MTSIDGLRISMHLRLLPREFKTRTLPIIFVSNREQWQINLLCRNNRDKNHFDYLLGTKGTDLTGPNAEDILAIVDNLKPLDDHEYKTDFYDHIKILPPDRLGKHSLANIWGAFKLAEVTGHHEKLRTNVELLKKQKELYFKSINSISPSSLNPDRIPVQQRTIPSTNKRILFIDDEANKGWSIVLKSIFKDSSFKPVDMANNESFEAFYHKAAEAAMEVGEDNLPNWDLILLDLRLDEAEDLGDAAFKTAKEYSGGKLLLEIKQANPGTQVIMFTASNKAWNMRELLSLGADGLYIKETPEYNQVSFSANNYAQFESLVTDCFNKAFLKRIYQRSLPIEILCKEEMDRNPMSYSLSLNQGTVKKIDEQLFVFKKLLNDYAFDLKWAFITIVLIIEEIVNDSYYQDSNDQVVSPDGMTKKKCNFIRNGQRILALTPSNFGNNYADGEHIVTADEMSLYDKRDVRTPFNFRLSCLLYFKYKVPLNNSIFKFFDVYKLRSESVAHVGNRTVTEGDVNLTLELLSILVK